MTRTPEHQRGGIEPGFGPVVIARPDDVQAVRAAPARTPG